MVDSVGGQSDPSAAHSAAQAQATVASTTGSAANVPGSVSLGTLLESMSTMAASMSANESSDSTTSTSQTTGTTSDESASTGLTDSQTVSGKQDSGEGDGGEKGTGEEEKNDSTVSYTGSSNLTGIGPTSTSASANAAAGIELRSSETLSSINAQTATGAFISPNTTAFATSINDMSSNFATAAAQYGLPAEVTAQATPGLEKASNLANELSALSSPSQGVMTKFCGEINSALTQALTPVVEHFANNPATFASAVKETFSLSDDTANKIATTFSSMVGVKDSGTSSTSSTAYNPLDTGSLSLEMTAVAGFSAAASQATALMDSYTANINAINAQIGTETASESDVVTANTQSQLKSNEKEEKKEAKEEKRMGIMGKIFQPLQDLAPLTSAVLKIGGELIHAIVPQISAKEGSSLLKDLTPSGLSAEIGKGINAAAESLSKAIPGLSVAAAKEILNAVLNPNIMATVELAAVQGVGALLELADPHSSALKEVVNKTTDIAQAQVDVTSAGGGSASQRMSDLMSIPTLMITDLATALTSLVCVCDPKADKDKSKIEMGITIALMAILIIASCAFGGEAAAPEAIEEIAAEGVEEGASEGAEEGTEVATEDAEASTKTEASSTNDSSIEGKTKADSPKSTPAEAPPPASAPEEAEEDGAGRSAISSGDGASEDAQAVTPLEDDDPELTNTRDSVTEGDGAKEDADAASKATSESDLVGDKTILTPKRMATIMKSVTYFQTLGSIAQNAMTIQKSLLEIKIAETTYNLAVNTSILSLLQNTQLSGNTSASNTTSAITGNISGENTAGGNMLKNAASSVSEIQA